MKTVFSTLLIVLLISASPVYAQAPRATSSDKTNLVGQVVDSYEREPNRSAFVVIHSEGGQEDQVVTVDPKGRYEVALVPGYYNVMIGASEFAPACKRVQIVYGRTSHFNPKLSPDTEHLEQSSSH